MSPTRAASAWDAARRAACAAEFAPAAPPPPAPAAAANSAARSVLCMRATSARSCAHAGGAAARELKELEFAKG